MGVVCERPRVRDGSRTNVVQWSSEPASSMSRSAHERMSELAKALNQERKPVLLLYKAKGSTCDVKHTQPGWCVSGTWSALLQCSWINRRNDFIARFVFLVFPLPHLFSLNPHLPLWDWCFLKPHGWLNRQPLREKHVSCMTASIPHAKTPWPCPQLNPHWLKPLQGEK